MSIPGEEHNRINVFRRNMRGLLNIPVYWGAGYGDGDSFILVTSSHILISISLSLLNRLVQLDGGLSRVIKVTFLGCNIVIAFAASTLYLCSFFAGTKDILLL